MAVDDPSADPLIGKTLDDRYRVRRLLGRGGMGAVYEAEHVGLGKRVAIKFISGDIDPDALARFRREARVAGQLAHDRVIDIYDVGEDAGLAFIAMEYVEGRDLRSVIEDGKLDAARTIAIARQILDGLSAIHAAGIVHRDLKPANILLAPGDAVKIMDFGISKAANDAVEITRSGTMVGTPQYMAPEQLLGSDVDLRADLYAVGLTLYAMLAGEPPFSATSTMALAAMQMRDPPPSLDELRPGLPRPLVQAIERALEKDPRDRFDDALAFAAALDGIAPSRPAGTTTAATRREGLASLPPASAAAETRREGSRDRDNQDAREATRRELQQGPEPRETDRREPPVDASKRFEPQPPVGASKRDVEPRHEPEATKRSEPGDAETRRGPETKNSLEPGAEIPFARPAKMAGRAWVPIAGVGVAAALGIAIAVWPREAPDVQPQVRVIDAAVPQDPIDKAREAERAGKLELAIAHYLEAHATKPDPELLFRIGELYERSNRTGEAVGFFRRYLDEAPNAKDRDAVTARIARLEVARERYGGGDLGGFPGPRDAGVARTDAAVVVGGWTRDAGIDRDANDDVVFGRPVTRDPWAPDAGVARAVDAGVARSIDAGVATSDPSFQCNCESDDPRLHMLCKKPHPPLCRCDSEYSLCPQRFAVCPGGKCPVETHANVSGTYYSCPTPWLAYHIPNVQPGASCSGFASEDLESDPKSTVDAPLRQGKYECSVCRFPGMTAAQWNAQMDYTGPAGAPCKGYLRTGEFKTGKIVCTPRGR